MYQLTNSCPVPSSGRANATSSRRGPLQRLSVISAAIALSGPALCFGQTAASAAAKPTKEAGPRIHFAEPAYDFGKLDSGTVVKHDYVFTNTGSALLEITSVRPSCGCTTAGTWDKEVEPGKTGRIPIQFNSGGYGGAVHKTITVACNDAAQTNVVLDLTGTLWKPIEVAPAYAIFTPSEDSISNETRKIKIVSNLEEPLALSDLQCTNHAFRAELKTVKEGKEFELLVTALAPFSRANHWVPIFLKTSSSRMPVITVNAYVNVQPDIVMLPSQIRLPPGPLTNASKFMATIRNNSTSALVLSDATINLYDVGLKLSEVQAGRVFTVTATFPAGFQSQPGQLIEAHINSNNPKYPILKLPFFQMPAPSNSRLPVAAASSAAPATHAAPKSFSPAVAAQRRSAPPNSGAGTTTGNSGPRIQFAEPKFDFGKVDSGEIIKHTFVFTNTGTQLLEITGVRPSCGCTTAGEWDKKVEPGKTGSIPIQFRSAGYGGHVLKSITVYCNVPGQTNVFLQLSGALWRPIEVAPRYAIFGPMEDSQKTETRKIKITSNLEEPVTLSDLQCKNPAFHAELKTVKEGKEYELEVVAVPPFQRTNVWSPITLKTSSAKMPKITVNCYLNVRPLIAVLPSQIAVPSGPLTNSAQVLVSLHNNSTNSVTFSDPTVNVKGVDLKLKEVRAGRVFNLTATFPVGFKSQPGQRMEVTLKSSHPKYPVVKIPIYQIAPPINIARPTAKPSPVPLVKAAQAAKPAPAVTSANAGAAAKAAATPPANAVAKDGPRIQFAEPIHDFGKVDSGTVIKYDYVFTNTGNAVLEITGVRPSCGCTAAGEFDKRVEPGKTGRIPIQFKSAGYGGQATKTIKVSCNDPARHDVILKLKGTLFRPIDVRPLYAIFTPGPDALSNETRVIKITNNLDEPLTLSDLQCTNRAFQAELKTVRQGKEFELRVTAVAPFHPRFTWAPITLKTSTPRMPTLTVNSYIRVQPAIALLPSQITLPAGPLPKARNFTLTVRNNTTNSISLSDPEINVRGAELKMTEVQPGRLFTFTATFPSGFKSQAGELMEASVKSSDPRHAVIKIPIVQLPGPSSGSLPASAAPAKPQPAARAASSAATGTSASGVPRRAAAVASAALVSGKEAGGQ